MKQSIIFKLPQAEFIELVKNSNSVREILKKLGYNPSNGGLSKMVRTRMSEEGLEFNVKRRNARNRHSKLPIETYLIENSDSNRVNVKRRLIEEGYLEYRCYNPECGLNEWLGKPITLHLDHINGVNNDNRINNLRLLCPNCHSQTDTYSGKNVLKHSDIRCS